MVFWVLRHKTRVQVFYAIKYAVFFRCCNGNFVLRKKPTHLLLLQIEKKGNMATCKLLLEQYHLQKLLFPPLSFCSVHTHKNLFFFFLEGGGKEPSQARKKGDFLSLSVSLFLSLSLSLSFGITLNPIRLAASHLYTLSSLSFCV